MVPMLMIEFDVTIFAWFLCSLGPPSHALVVYHREWGGIPLHDTVGVNCETGATTDIKAQVPSLWAMWCMLDNCA